MILISGKPSTAGKDGRTRRHREYAGCFKIIVGSVEIYAIETIEAVILVHPASMNKCTVRSMEL